jgi:hypothetical protein
MLTAACPSSSTSFSAQSPNHQKPNHGTFSAISNNHGSSSAMVPIQHSRAQFKLKSQNQTNVFLCSLHPEFGAPITVCLFCSAPPSQHPHSAQPTSRILSSYPQHRRHQLHDELRRRRASHAQTRASLLMSKAAPLLI